MRVQLNYTGKKEPVLTGLQRVSKPGLRVYVQKREIPRVYGGWASRSFRRRRAS